MFTPAIPSLGQDASGHCLSLLFSMEMENLFNIFALLQIAAGLYLLWQGIVWLAYVRRRLKTDPGFYAPRTAVICPCRGMEPGLERNLVSLCEFDHQNYEVFFVLASESDPAYSIVKRVASTSRAKAHVIIAGKPENTSEKVNNLRVAVEQLPEEFEVLVFADSDGRPVQKLAASPGCTSDRLSYRRYNDNALVFAQRQWTTYCAFGRLECCRGHHARSSQQEFLLGWRNCHPPRRSSSRSDARHLAILL